MKPNIFLIGGGGYCKSVIDVIELEGKYNIIDKKESMGQNISGYKIVGSGDNLEKLFEKYKFSVVTIGQIKSNYWLQAVLVKDINKREQFLDYTNKNGVMTRPIWKLMNELEMFKGCQCGNLDNAKYLEQRVVNISSSVRESKHEAN